MFTFTGTATPGDLVMLGYSAPRGGRSTAKYRVKDGTERDEIVYDAEKVASIKHTSVPADTMANVVSGLASCINGIGGECEWSPGTGDFRAIAKGETLMVMCSDLVSDLTFHADVDGKGTEKIAIEVLG